MSIAVLTELVAEKGTQVITVAFTDEAGTAVTPNSGLAWTLTDRYGNVVNSRTSVSVTPASSVNIVLSGSDLAVSSSYTGRWRVLTVQGTYDSDAGSNLPLKNEVHFVLGDLVAVT